MNNKNYSNILLVPIFFFGLLSACAPASVSSVSQPVTEATATVSSSVSDSSGTSSETTTEVSARINLNTATEADFLNIPDVGSRMVREFMEYRPYSSIAQFEKEIGKYVDSAQVSAYEQYVFVPISVNQSDSATLSQISGLDAAEVESLIAGRPYASNEDFLTALSKLVSSSELTAAKEMLASS